MSSGDPDRISDWFTEDFRLHEPDKPALPVGHEGARQMMEAGRQSRVREGVQMPAKVEILDMCNGCSAREPGTVQVRETHIAQRNLVYLPARLRRLFW